ncbi:MAG: 50S ribosomal protein L20 [Candidatus Woesebacteria bacterium GW2011_GWA1_37_8]|uniref:Large ribosomal subunit protein bL20 n=2 Tax=Candidatus Woeseibacteriota TaxID=1752722 RepID=A0A0G0PB80_9BACT|nr:MAG: 50S ribosomal protein L20 [Microgenomates group bacterium GW2011_GWC1_37_12b]KKQ44066.1 MAG: 50S ribosomal protein L20 [Candidatus Woesebacteria bacterium GW2011_GWA1_37_8]KKQ86556.1 MAG: 50S ribosomal protein L20 [Candidatus Woesebacteria bacterium GW2011_GWB1_38_8b]
MTRVKSVSARNHRKTLKAAKGFKQARRRRIKTAKEAVLHAGQYAYIGRKQKKRNLRSLWIIRMNAALRESGATYSKFISSLKKKNILLDRKILAEIAVKHPEDFKSIVEIVKK